MLRTPTRAEGGITAEEKLRMDAIRDKWIKITLKTGPVDRNALTAAIKGLYSAAKLDVPRVVIVPSPRVMAFAYGISAGWWDHRAAARADAEESTRQATDLATRQATRQATDLATRQATWQATELATRQATWQATDLATDLATRQATELATRQATELATSQATRQATWQATSQAITNIRQWAYVYQGGNMWAGFSSYAESMRDVLGLSGLDCWKKYHYWEQAAIHGGFRAMHEKFCIVSEFPEYIKTEIVNGSHRAHCADGPSHMWSDGFCIFSWHGINVPGKLIMAPESITRKDILSEKNSEVSRAYAEKLGWDRYFKLVDVVKIDAWHDDNTGLHYELYDFKNRIGELQPCLLRMESPKLKDGTMPIYIEPVPPEIKTAKAARRWQIPMGANEKGIVWPNVEDCNKNPELVFGWES